MSEQTPQTPGWYPNPDGTPGERWWDGFEWSQEFVRGPAEEERVPVLDHEEAETFLTYGAEQRRIAVDSYNSDTATLVGLVFVASGAFILIANVFGSSSTGIVLQSRVSELVIGTLLVMNGLRVIMRSVYR